MHKTHLLSLSGSHPGELGHVLHDLEVGLHQVCQPGHAAELGDQGDGLDNLLLLLGFLLGKRRKVVMMLNVTQRLTGLPLPW